MKRKFFIAWILCVVFISCTEFFRLTDEEMTAIEAKNHKHTFATKWTSDKTHHWHAATCEHKDEVSGMAEHTPGDWETVSAAKEESEGEEKTNCTVCGYELKREIPKLNHEHDYSGDWEKNETSHWKQCSCGEKNKEAAHSSYVWENDGDFHWKICDACKAKFSEAAHTFGDWETVTAATTTTQGSKKKTCSVCKKEITETIPMLGAANITVTLAENSDYEISYTTSGTQITVTVPELPSGVTYKLIVDNKTVYETDTFNTEGLESGSHLVIVKFSDGKSSYLTFTLE